MRGDAREGLGDRGVCSPLTTGATGQTMLSVKLARVALSLFEELATPVSLGAAIRLRYKDWQGLCSLSVSPRDYIDDDRYCRDSAAVSFLKKFKGSIPGVDRREVAVSKWEDGERQCYKSNQRLWPYADHLTKDLSKVTDDCMDQRILGFLSRVRKEVESWLGPKPPDAIVGKFGPGATFADKSRKATIPDKITSSPTLTSGAVLSLLGWVGTAWSAHCADAGGKLVTVPGNRFTTAPKTALVDRPIAVEPSINIYFQLGAGQAIRRRLRISTGWDLDHAQEVHREMALRSSVSREFATLDLSNASDTLCKQLVRAVLPTQWYRWLHSLRSPKTETSKGHWVVLEKFSSMGNGYTFELETVVFAAIAATILKDAGEAGVLGHDVFVFGDDIIVPTRHSDSVVAALRFCGMTLNDQKSFSDGLPFRESCGGDFFDGRAVRPFSLKEEPLDVVGQIGLVNMIHGIASRTLRKKHTECETWKVAHDLLEPWIRKLRGPQSLGDLVIWDEEDRWITREGEQGGIKSVRTVKVVPRYLPWGHWKPTVVLACAVYGAGEGDRGVIPRDPTLRFRSGWTTLPGSSWLPSVKIGH